MTLWTPHLDDQNTPRYLAIADAIERDIRQGALPTGARMPTHRDLADRLGVTVGTVTRGYAEAARRGLLRGETGRGTFVGTACIATLTCHREDSQPGEVELGLTLPFEELNPDLGRTLTEIAADNPQQLLEYYPSAGRMADRLAGVQWLERYNVEVPRENVVVTSGGQNGLAVILSSMLRPGDAIAVEGVTYPLVKTLARRFHFKLVPIELDEEGMIPESLAEACRSQTIRAVYLMPTCQNPTTVRLSEYRRHAIAELARKHDLMIIEDEAYGLIAPEMGIPMVMLAPERTFFIASLSKCVAGGLRVGYVAAPDKHMRCVERALSDMIWMTPPLMAEVARRWIADGTADRTCQAKREAAHERCALARKLLKDFDFTLPQSSFYGWLALPAPWTSGDFVRAAEEQGIRLIADDMFTVGRTPRPHGVRVALCGTTEAGFIRGMEQLANILQTR